MNTTCYESASTIVAAADGYIARNVNWTVVNWTVVHWTYRARCLMNAAYYRSCAEHGDGAEMLPAWVECEARMRAKYLAE